MGELAAVSRKGEEGGLMTDARAGFDFRRFPGSGFRTCEEEGGGGTFACGANHWTRGTFLLHEVRAIENKSGPVVILTSY